MAKHAKHARPKELNTRHQVTEPVHIRQNTRRDTRPRQMGSEYQAPAVQPHVPLTAEQQRDAWAEAPVVLPLPKKKKLGCLLPFTVVVLLLVVAIAAIVIIRPSFAEPIIAGITGTQAAQVESDAEANSAAANLPVKDTAVTEQAKETDRKKAMHTCRMLAQCQGVDIYSPIPQDQLTGVLMHQASYEWGQPLTTELPEADMEQYNAGEKPLRVNNKQTEGTWADADAAHLWREQDDTPMDTAIDVGAPVGTTVYAPVTGTVIAVCDYDLYDETKDVRIHIRPDDNKDLDVVILHQSDPKVKVGDHVEAGVTPISKVRDIASVLTDVQLAFYTDTDGNHSHVQVNDLTDKAYLEKYELKVD